MKVQTVRNVHEALWKGMRDIAVEGFKSESRNGPVLRFPTPVVTAYTNPWERVCFWADRDAHPYFHFFESVWMLAGRRDVKFVEQFVPRMREFSDDGETFHGAYGYRWRHWFAGEQLHPIWEALKKDNTDRRQVLTMWDATYDLQNQTGKKDLPCNLQVIFQVNVFGRLDMTVTNRSNDMIWGAYGANAVHFSYLHEFMAAAVGVPMGMFYQFSNNLHAYIENPVYQRTAKILLKEYSNPYSSDSELSHRTLQVELSPYRFLDDCEEFLDNPDKPLPGLSNWIRRVAMPMWQSWRYFNDKEDSKRFIKAKNAIMGCEDFAWRKNVSQWLERREAARVAK